tara:strand:- start:1807 stop:2976 length:1170 start_codon:yes stop_codon:yes gene_type:complete
MTNKILFYLLLIVSYFSFSQSIYYSNNTLISVLTCAPGDELYSKFGHSAFRVQDFDKQYDVVYNFGVFDQQQPFFYLNFAKGKMSYKLDKSNYKYFYRLYEYENREVKKQTLNLTSQQRKKIISFLENNAKPENATYQYDFFYNNCATKIRSVLETVFPNEIIFNNDHITTSYTMRDLINNNVPCNSWANVGINIALGSVIDYKATSDEYQFLPEYIFKGLNNATINSTALITETATILETDEKRIIKKSFSLLSPYAVLSLIGLLVIFITYSDFKKNVRTKALDFTLLFITGFTGVFSLLLWFATNHTTTAANFNILWAFAPNLFMAFLIFKDHKTNFKAIYFKLLTALMLLLGVIWLFKIEAFAYGMIPIFIALGIRYFYLSRYFKS